MQLKDLDKQSFQKWKENTEFKFEFYVQNEKIEVPELFKQWCVGGMEVAWHAALAQERSDYQQDDLRSQLMNAFNQIEVLKEALSYYANTEIYRRPDKDRNGMGGMSAMTDFEIDDGEWKLDENNEKDHYCYGKLARKVLREL